MNGYLCQCKLQFCKQELHDILLHSIQWHCGGKCKKKKVGLIQLVLKNRVMCALFVPGVAEGESMTKLYVHLIDKWATGETHKVDQ